MDAGGRVPALVMGYLVVNPNVRKFVKISGVARVYKLCSGF